MHTLITLKIEIARLAAAGRAQRVVINSTRGIERHEAWQSKRGIGAEARACLLAYAMLRGRSRVSTESPTNVIEPVRHTLARDVAALTHETPTADDIRAVNTWLATPPTPAELARCEACAAAGRAWARAARAAALRGRAGAAVPVAA